MFLCNYFDCGVIVSLYIPFVKLSYYDDTFVESHFLGLVVLLEEIGGTTHVIAI